MILENDLYMRSRNVVNSFKIRSKVSQNLFTGSMIFKTIQATPDDGGEKPEEKTIILV